MQERNKLGQLQKGHKGVGIKQGEEHGRYRHGLSRTRIYARWNSMLTRCYNKNEKYYKNWGGRGIKVCDEWLDFVNFNEDMGDTYQKGMALERLDNDEDYSPENCKWIPKEEQNLNKRNVKIYEYDGKKLNSSQWDRELGLQIGTVRARLKYGWSVEKAVSTPVQKRNYKLLVTDK